MNYKAIDAGVDAVHKVEVPADWATAVDDKKPVERTGRPATVKMVNELLDPIGKMDGDSLPVSAFKDIADGQFETGASAYEKRGTAVMVPEWDPASCVQCNSCAFVCSHATIRPFILDAKEQAEAPSQIKLADSKHATDTTMKYTMSVSPLDCMGCGECVTVCPKAGEALKMVPQESQAEEQPVFDYLVANVGKKDIKPALVNTPIGSQYNQPLLEFSGSCAGCAETSYARLITQLFGEQMYISNATGCSSIWGGPAATSPYTVNKDTLKGPAWANSLFEDNAEHGFGMYLGQKVLRDQLLPRSKKWLHLIRQQTALRQQQLSTLRQRMILRQTHQLQKLLLQNLKRQQQMDAQQLQKYLLRRITLLRNLYGSSVVMDGLTISVSVVLTMYLLQVRM